MFKILVRKVIILLCWFIRLLLPFLGSGCGKKSCFMCDPVQYKFLPNGDRKIKRLVSKECHTDPTYVIVPRESHVKHHLLVVLKAQDGAHKKGLIDCEKGDLVHLGATISRWCSILKQLKCKDGTVYDTVYAGCYSDEEHVHFHLIPFTHKQDKRYSGFAMTWLAEKECNSAANPFCRMSDEKKRKRLGEIEEIVNELGKAADDYDRHATGGIASPPNEFH